MAGNMKYFMMFPIMFILHCSSLGVKDFIPFGFNEPKIVQKSSNVKFDNAKEAFDIKWNVLFKYPTQKKGFLVITDKQTKKSYTITYQEFFVLKKSYKNWRVVEKQVPVITKIKEDDGFLFITFNYLDENKSILSGQFIINTAYIKDRNDTRKLNAYRGVTFGLGTYSVMTTLFCILLALF